MFDPSLFLPSPHDALQAPAHRWLRCQYLLDCGLLPTPLDDALTQTAYAFCRNWDRCQDDRQRKQLTLDHPVLSEALLLYQGGMTGQRAELEARLLAGQDDASIADRCHLTPGVVQLFHGLFFEVRPHLQAPVYIVDVAIGPKVHHGLQANDHDILLKIAGYTLGPFGVDDLLAYWADPPAWPVCLASLDDASLETLRGKLRVQAWILSLTLPADSVTAARLPAIRATLAQAGVFGNRSASGKNDLPFACPAVLDYRALLSAPEVVECKAAKPASAAVASSVGESDGLVTAGPTDWQVVPA